MTDDRWFRVSACPLPDGSGPGVMIELLDDDAIQIRLVPAAGAIEFGALVVATGLRTAIDRVDHAQRHTGTE